MYSHLSGLNQLEEVITVLYQQPLSHSFGLNHITSVLEKSAKPKCSQNSCKMFLADAACFLPMNSAFEREYSLDN